MLSIEEQIGAGKLVCPVTHQPLRVVGDRLNTLDGAQTYPFVNGIPILIDPSRQREYLAQNNRVMELSYKTVDSRPRIVRWFEEMSMKGGDYRNSNARDAIKDMCGRQTEESLCLSVGGGQLRLDPKFVNVNIADFPNVDVVGDVYELPYADGVVDCIHCEAVLEHLELPDQAVSEMHRVLCKNGLLFAATPFLQAYHGFPDHYQNYTHTGHRRLFERAGFTIISSGVCVGPTFAIHDLLTTATLYAPTAFLRKWLYRLMRMAGPLIRPLDTALNAHSAAHILASTTYVYAFK